MSIKLILLQDHKMKRVSGTALIKGLTQVGPVERECMEEYILKDMGCKV